VKSSSTVFHYKGRTSDPKKIGREFGVHAYVSPFQAAVVYAGLDERQLALDWLEKSRQERFNWLPFIKVDPVFKNLRSEQRFIDLTKNLGLN